MDMENSFEFSCSESWDYWAIRVLAGKGFGVTPESRDRQPRPSGPRLPAPAARGLPITEVMTVEPTEISINGSRWANVRLTEEEHQALDVIQDRLQTTRSRLLRKIIRELIGMGPDLLDQEWKIMEDLIYQLAAVGRNLNQLLKAIHTGKTATMPADRVLIEQVSDNVLALKKEIITLVERSRQRWVKDAA